MHNDVKPKKIHVNQRIAYSSSSDCNTMDVHWTGGLDRKAGQAWSMRVGCPLDR